MEMLRNIVPYIRCFRTGDKTLKILSNPQQKVDDLAAKSLGNLKNLRDSHAALSVGISGTVAGEPSSVTR
ncbi:unnamed protein product [Brassica rapa subsp. narinosa]|uniref:(rape) hypothetical protein n=1 Tax=Brassica napus TaxID=3708 RepID=A0A817BI92_BRANA|nr:unnamed protein product [Brassica napus]